MSDLKMNLNDRTIHPADPNSIEFKHTVSPELRQVKLRLYMYMGGSVLLGAAASLFTRLIFTSPWTQNLTSAVPAAGNISLFMVMGLTLLVSIIFRKGNPRIVRFLFTLDCLAAGALFSVICLPLPTRLFAASLGMSVLLIECMIYLIFKTKYDQAYIDPVCYLGVCPADYIFQTCTYSTPQK